MLPPEFESIAAEARRRFRVHVGSDESAEEFPDLLTVEQDVGAFVRELGLGLLQDFVDVREEKAKRSRPSCSCGRRLQLHRRTRWTRKTLLGPLTVHDPYAYCRVCGDSDRPLHAWLGTDRETWSLAVQEAAVDLASDESCGKAVAKLARHHPGVVMDRTAALRMLHDHGKHARGFIDRKLREARELAGLPWGRRSDTADELEVEHDCGMIPVATMEPLPVAQGEEPERTPVRGLPKRRRVCRWEEVKAGLVQKPGETTRLYSLRPTSGLDAAFDDLLALACMKGWTETTRTRGIADGAVHIRPRLEETFDVGDFRFILDRPHCKEHLSAAGEAMAAADDVDARAWADRALADMEAGGAEGVVDELRAAHLTTGDEVLRLEAGYFERNADAVAYADYREHGWSTASSEIESAHRHTVQVRMKLPGAWWHPDGVDDILALRMLKANDWWDEYWNDRRRAWRTRAETFAEERRHRAA